MSYRISALLTIEAGRQQNSIYKWMSIYTQKQARREGGVGGKLPRAPRRLGAPPSLRNIKYTRLHYFKKKNSKIFSPKGPCETVWRGVPQEFPRASLWLSTGLLGSSTVAQLHEINVRL